MIERHFRSLQQKIRRSSLVSEQIAGFLPYFNKPSRFSAFSMRFLRQTDGSLSVHFGSWHAVYSYYIPDSTKESPVLPWFFPSAEISGIRNRFSVRQRLLLLESNGSSGTGFLFHSGCSHRIPDAFSKSFWKDTVSYFPSLSYIFPCMGTRCSLHIHIRLLLRYSRFCFSVSL